MITREEFGRKLSNFINRLKGDRRVLGVFLVVITLVVLGAGSLTGHFILKPSESENELSLTKLELETCQKNLEKYINTTTNLSEQLSILEGDISVLTGNLNNCNSERDFCDSSLGNCTEKKNILTSELDISKHELEKKTDQYDKLLDDYEEIKESFANNKCCSFYNDGYRYYTIKEENKIFCCYKLDDLYFCGFGPDVDEVAEDNINELNC